MFPLCYICFTKIVQFEKRNSGNVQLIFIFTYKYKKTRPISDGFRKNNVNYWAFREIRSIIPHL